MASVYTVAQVTSYISHLLEEDFALKRISIQGEISNCRHHTSGHLYFTLKDDKSTLSCVMFASYAAKLTCIPREGMSVVAKGSIRIYERDGKYQLYVTAMEPAGTGEWYRLFEERKAMLEEMGLFSPEYKKPIPRYARTVGVVTASTGAAIQDIINISHRRNPYVQLVLYPSLVQGASAAADIAKGIAYLDTLGLDVIIVGRGGGSIEDLWAFNEECVAMAIFQCDTPVISAVGHETDFTIADFAADLRAPTPSAAAELAVFEYDAFAQELEALAYDMRQSLMSVVTDHRRRLEQLGLLLKLSHPREKLRQQREQLSRYRLQMKQQLQLALEKERHRLVLASELLEARSPLSRLKGGYAFLTDTHQVPLCRMEELSVGDCFQAHMEDGIVEASVTACLPRSIEERLKRDGEI